MKVVLINPPHTAIGSRIPDHHPPPLGLLCLGGPLVDADLDNLPLDRIVEEAVRQKAETLESTLDRAKPGRQTIALVQARGA